MSVKLTFLYKPRWDNIRVEFHTFTVVDLYNGTSFAVRAIALSK